MKKIVLGLVLVLLAGTVNAVEIKNPDGRPGTFGLEPFLNVSGFSTKTSATSFSTSNRHFRGGLRFIVPASEKATIFASAGVGQSTASFSDGITSSDGSGVSYEFSFSVRIWLKNKPRPRD